EYLILRGMPQRRAHHLVGAIVGEAMRRELPLAQLPLDVLRQHAPELDEGVRKVLGAANAVAAFRSEGSTSPERVAEQVSLWKTRLVTEAGA
ncbi:MAG: argininosuccinate lyase, partial [Planctomycetaceae bacterium]